MAKGASISRSADGSEKSKDPEVEELKIRTARIAARQELVQVQLAALGALAPGVTDAPANSVTLGEKAGALAPWLAQGVLGDVAGGISAEVWGVMHPSSQRQQGLGGQQQQQDAPAAAKGSARVIFVTDDANLLASDVVSRQVEFAVAGRTDELRVTVGNLKGARTELKQAVDRYEEAEKQQEQDGASGIGHAQPEVLRSLLANAKVAAVNAAEEAAAVQESSTADLAKEGDAAVETEGGAAGAGPIGAAIDLVRLLAVDYTLTTAEVPVDSALLARLTAGQLATSRACPVKGDGRGRAARS